MTKEIMESQGNSPAEMIRVAVANGADLEKLRGLLELQEKWDAMQAKKAYHEAMSAFKVAPPVIDKDKTVAYGNTKYNHATLANVTAKIGAALSKHGLSASWTTKQDAGGISVTCKITHVKGHSEETTLTAGADTSGSKNAIQAIGSAITYLERYTLLALTGLATSEADDDGQAAAAEYITEDQQSHLLDLITDKEVILDKFLAFLKVESLDTILRVDYKKAVSALEAKKKAVK